MSASQFQKSKYSESKSPRTSQKELSSAPSDIKVTASEKVHCGRRKTAVARVRILPGSGRIFVNGMLAGDYFTSALQEWLIFEPLRVSGVADKVDVFVNVRGGGKSSQAGATRLGIAKCLCELDESISLRLRKEGFLARDPREKERRKYGLKKARKAPQYSKR